MQKTEAYIPEDKEVDDGDYVLNLEDLETVQTQELQYNGYSSEESHAELDSEKSDTSEDENNAAKVNNLQVTLLHHIIIMKCTI